MKKLFVGLLSIFLLVGASILSACGEKKPVLSLSRESVEIELYSGDLDGGYETVTAEVFDANDTSISVSANGYEQIVKVDTEPTTSGKTLITITGLQEGYAEVIVRTNQGNAYKTINVDVYSEVSEMSQKVEEVAKKKNYAIRGMTNTLVENSLIEFKPSANSRRNITWTFENDTNQTVGASIEGNKLTITDEYTQNEITLKATTEKDISTLITIPVINKIEANVSFEWSYSENSEFQEIDPKQNYKIVPNVPADDLYEAYISVNYTGELDITPVVTTKAGVETTDVSVVRYAEYNNRPLFKVFANKDKVNINGDYIVYFEIGYKNFDYSINSLSSCPINVSVREKVNDITISSDNAVDIEGSEQTIYTDYAGKTEKGKEFNVSITPTTVIGATNKYSITVHRESAGEAIADGCPVEIWYRDALNGNIWTQIPLVENPESGDYVTIENNLPSVKKIYIKASKTLKVQSYQGISLTFTSQDNQTVSTTFKVKLVRSVSIENFEFKDADFRVDSGRESGVTIKKTFTLKGQTSVEGLYIINNSKYVEITQPQKISSNENSVTFEIILTLKKEGFGVTSLDNYQIAHENGLISEKFNIDIFLPLKEASVIEDKENPSNSVTDRDWSNSIYLSNGQVYNDKAGESLSKLMLKYGSTTPVLYSYNTASGQSSVANLSVSYYDFSQSGLELTAFKELMNNPAGVAEIINKSKENVEKVSGVANFTNDYSNIITKSVGFTYAVLSFTGKGVENVDQDGNITLIRIMLIESYIGPDGLDVTPNANKQISLYANDTVASRDEDETKKRITINFANNQITYKELSNFEFVSTRLDSNNKPVMGEQTISGNNITWENGRYSITNITITSNSISFDVVALTTMSDHAFYDDLVVHYILRNDEGKKVTDIYTPISITIKNAQRIESVIWENSDDDGIYFEIGKDVSLGENDETGKPYYMLVQTSPTNAKNNNLSYIITDKDGGVISDFVSISSDYSANTLAVNLSKNIKEGMTGYIYVLPEDAVYNDFIKYYYMQGENEVSEALSVKDLGVIKDNLTNQTWYEFLTKECYFKSITSAENVKKISFADVLLKVKVTVADGKSFDYAYRVYDSNGFVNMKSNLYYTVMNSIDLTGVDRSGEDFRTSFNGGLQGYNKDVTIRIEGNNFSQQLSEGATIRNIKFAGNVTNSNGFIVDTNNGTISNVTVDVNDRYASTLNVTNGVNAGGIAGQNNSLIENSSVLGLTINASISGSFVGGIAGQNAGTIKGSIVEFYNLLNRATTGENDKYTPNTFTGVNVGGLVGQILNNSTIEKSYVYDYNLSKDSSDVLIGYGDSKKGNFAGVVADDADPKNTKIDYSFAVLGDGTPYVGYTNNTTKVTITNSYVGFYGMDNTYEVTYLPEDYMTNNNYVKNGDEGFLNYVNNGEAHLKDFYQDEKVSSVNYSVKTTDTSNTNGYYKSIGENKENSNKGILFNYRLEDNPNGLTSSEQKDLDKLNTISLAELVGEDNISRNIIVSSSASNILKVVGSDIIVNKTGDVVLTLSSKQDVSLFKEIYVKVIYAMSDVIVSWTDISGNTNIVDNDSVSYLQKTKTRDYIVGFDKTSVVIGNTAHRYDLVLNNNINMTVNLSGETTDGQSLVSFEKISNEVFKFTASKNAVDTKVNLTPVVFESETEDYQRAINNVFERNFNISPIDGVISFALSGENLPITPSINGTVKVQIETTDEKDYIIPQVRYNNEELKETDENDVNLYSFVLPKDEQENIAILDARISRIADKKDKETGVYTYIYEVNFAVNKDYKNKISEDFTFDVSFVSKSGNDSKDSSKGSFELIITRQEFNNIDVNNIKIKNSYYENENENENGEFLTIHETGSKTGVLAPGNSSVLQINVNPSFAYYDYMEISYSGATVSNAVNIELVKPYKGSDNKFVRASDSNVQTVGSSLRFTPTAEEKTLGIVYYKLWINSTVNSDSTIKFTVRFFESEGKQLEYVNYYLSISYLKEPLITIDGNDTSYIAKGSQAKVEITVLADQTVESPIVVGENVKGINISSLSEPVYDEIRGTKTYTATLSTTVLAEVADNTFYVQAKVNRDLNGITESKTTIATAVIVDFKIDTNKIEIAKTEDNHLDVWVGVPKPFDVDYKLIPEEYNFDASDKESSEEVNELNKNRNDFITKQYYPTSDAEKANYLINYIYDNNKKPQVQTLIDRLFYVINGNEFVHVNDSSVIENSPIEFKQNGDDVIVTGKTMGANVDLVLKTYISAGGVTAEYNTHFDVKVEAYSDPDLPLTISNASEFKNLNPENYDEIKPNDYILTNDIVLENYTPFDSSMIRSLDGNGYTIFIKNFNVQPEETNTLNLALFNNVIKDTTIKNVRVNMYNGGQLTIDVATYNTVNVAGLAITNKGTITNSEVVSFYCEDKNMGDVLLVDSCILHKNPEGINVKYVRGKNTTEEVFLTQNSKWTSNIAGFVVNNEGSITNSRVGGKSITILGAEKESAGKPTGYTYATTQNLGIFNIIAQGDMAGFVLSNTGAIASSFVKQLDMQNKSETTDFFTAGFVGTNSSSIITSFVEGVDTPTSVPAEDRSIYAKEGSSIKSKLGYIAGFIYTNNGKIKDSYSNILISNSTDTSRVYLASGFVYMNKGEIENCFSASQITNSKFTQMNFSGVDNEGNLLAEGIYKNCYFFNKAYTSTEDVNDNTTESQFGTGALMVTNPSDPSNFYGFAVADGESDGIWRREKVGTVSEKGQEVDKYSITLIETNNISHSHRYILPIDKDSNYEGVVGENEQGKYILPYATLQFIETGLEIDTTLGTKSNPILIADYQDFVEVTGTSTSTNIKKYYNDNMVWGTYRLVNNIDLSQLVSSDKSVVLPSTMKAFAGIIYGNGFEVSGISITSDKTRVAFGLFASIEDRKNIQPIITNLDISFNQVVAGDVVMVGGLAGYMKNAIIVNIDLSFNEKATLKGLSFAGGLTGLAFGNNRIKNISITNPTVTAERYSYVDNEDYLDVSRLSSFRTGLKNDLNFGVSIDSVTIKNMQNYSYAGSAIGFVDNYATEGTDFNINQADTYSINNIRVSGIVNVQAQVVGGIFGLTGYQTNVRDAGITIDGNSSTNSSHIISTKHFAGGVVGQSFGSLSRIFAVHNENTQFEIENNMSSFYQGNLSTQRGILDLFVSADEKYTQKYIGGIAGYVGSGKLEISYSKLNVTSPTADYAGGIIGGTELKDAKSYQVEPNTAIAPAYTKYFINEVYATGDVRGSVRAGGIIGAIKGEGSSVALLSVNAFNYFTTYNYETKEYENVVTAGNVSNNFKVNSIVGDFIHSKGYIDEGNLYQSYITFIQGKKEVKGSGDNVEIVPIPSVGYYSSYESNGFELFLNLFKGYDKDDLNQKESYVYEIESPKMFNSSEVGHTYTQEGFLNSGVWSIANWVHPTNDLFPGIRYQRSADVIYLDYYNVREVFAKMNNSQYTVVVRGLASKDSGNDNCKHIDLAKIKEEYEDTEELYIDGFRGRLIGGQGYKNDKGEDIKIIAENSFIKSAGQGFSIENLTIDYKGTQVESPGNGKEIVLNNDSSETGLLIQNSATQINISNVVLDIQAPVVYKTKGNGIEKIGLVAPSLTSSTINNLTIKFTNSEDSLLKISKNNKELGEKLYAGLIAGEYIQDSLVSIIKLEGIKLEVNGNLISLSDTNYKNYYIGGYFGRTAIEPNAQALRLTISDILKYGSQVEENQNHTYMSFSDVIQTNGALYLGGYIGKVDGLSDVATFEQRTLNIKLNYAINNNSEINNLNAGLIFGNKSSGTTLNFNGQNSVIDGAINVDTGVTLNNISAGGVIGENSGNSIKISNLSKINFGIIQDDNNPQTPLRPLSNNSFDESNLNGAVKVTDCANVGIIAGKNNAQLSFTGINSGTKLNPSKTEQNESNPQTIRLQPSDGAKVNFGSVVGSHEGTSLNIEGNIISNANILVANSEKEETTIQDNPLINIGGMVGYISGTETTIKGINKTGIIRYDGAVFSNVKNISFGGMVGSITDLVKMSITNTSFGGVLKVYGQNSNGGSVSAGGTLGSHSRNNEEKFENYKITMQNNYNYGDVFVQYSDNLKALGTYNFGGISGALSTYNYDIQNNYSLVTSHNSRYILTTNSAHALFGEGVPKNENKNNYYSHKVSLLTDDNGTDAGYNTKYSVANFGYGECSTETLLIDAIKDALGLNLGEGTGHKLNPKKLKSSEAKNGLITLNTNDMTNGIRYYVISPEDNSFDNKQIITTYTDEKTQKEESYNVAIIGEGQQIGYNSSNKDINAFIDKLSGYSFVSGVVLDVNITIDDAKNIDDAENKVYYAGLVSELSDQAVVYASQVKGKIDIGSYIENKDSDESATVTSQQVNISGLVGHMTGGKIFDCSTAVDITYRAAAQGNMYGIVCLEDKENDTLNKIIENTYATGSLETFIDTNMYAFTNGASYTTINNCYTITKLDWSDYTKESNIPDDKTTFSVFGNKQSNYKLSNVYYDQNALNVNISEDQRPEKYNTEGITIYKKSEHSENTKVTTKALLNLNPTNPTNSNTNVLTEDEWERSYDFNYRYPTLKYGYLKVSSYAKLNEKQQDTEKQQDEAKQNKIYDDYVIKNSYSRLANNQSPTSVTKEGENQYFFMIPNAGILSEIGSAGNLGLGKNYILMYDIDLNYTTSTIFNESKSLGDVNKVITPFTGEFDGQEKTISGLKNSLFASIGNSSNTISINNTNYTTDVGNVYVRNLRLTDATIENGNGILTQKINFATISNMTISGSLTGSKDYIGGLANELQGGFINTVTNMTNINISSVPKNTSKSVKVGGLVGLMNGGQIFYSSNYGPINVSINEEGIANYAGGLVGSIGSMDSFDKDSLNNKSKNKQETEIIYSNKIEYSYNSASVIAGYGTSTSSINKPGRYMVGGLVGITNQSTNIQNSYNAGMIKSGNKSNVYDDTLLYASYAAGIVALGHKTATTKIENCYNEGTVEALGKNPTYKWAWENNSDTGNKLSLTLRITSPRNVYAYGIGYLNGTGSSITNSQVRLADNNDNSTIYNNGSVIEENTLIGSWKWDDIKSNGTTLSKEYKGYIMEWAVLSIGVANVYPRKITVDIKPLQPKDEDKPDVKVSSENSLGLPMSFMVNIQSKLTATYFWRSTGGWGGYPGNWDKDWKDSDSENINLDSENSINSIIYDNYSVDCSTLYNDKFQQDKIGIEKNNEGTISIPSSDNKTTFTTNGDIKKNARSQQGSSKVKDLIVGDKKFYIAENNLNSIFNAGIYSYSPEDGVKVEAPYFEDISLYKLSAKINDKEINASIEKVTKSEEEGSIKIKYKVSSGEPIEGTLNLSLNINFHETIEFNISNFNYVYVDRYSIGIYSTNSEIKDKNANLLGYEIYAENNDEVKYKNVIRLSQTKYDENNSEVENPPPDDIGSENYLYLAYDEKNETLIFIPNATLINTNDNSKTTVNPVKFTNGNGTLWGTDNKEDNRLFIDNVKNLIKDKFSEKTYHIRMKQKTTIINQAISFTKSGSGNGSIENNSINKSDKIQYGQDIKNNIVFNISNESINRYNSSFDFILTNNLMSENKYSEYSIEYNNDTIAKYTFDSGWSEGNPNQLEINYNNQPYKFNISISEDNQKLMLSFGNINMSSSDLDTLIGQIQDYIKSNFKIKLKNLDDQSQIIETTLTNEMIASDNKKIITFIDYNFKLNLSNLNQDTLIIDGENILFGYKKDTNKLIGNTNSITIKGHEFTIKIDEKNQIILEANIEGETDIKESDILDCFNKFKYMINNWTNSTTITGVDKTEGLSTTIEIPNLGSVIINYNLNTLWTLTSGSDLLTMENATSKDIIVRFKENLQLYNGLNSKTLEIEGQKIITIYYGTLSFGAKCDVDIIIPSGGIEIRKNESVARIVYNLKIEDSEDPDDTPPLNQINVLTSDYFPAYGEIKIKGKATINVNYYSTYAMTEDDSGYVNVVLKTPNEKNIIINNTLDVGNIDAQNENFIGEIIEGIEVGLLGGEKKINLLVQMYITDVENKENPNFSPYFLYTFRDDDGNEILNKRVYYTINQGGEKEFTGKIEYRVFYGSKGEELSTAEKIEGKEETVVVPGQDKTIDDLITEKKIYISNKGNNTRYISSSVLEEKGIGIFSENEEIQEEIQNLITINDNCIYVNKVNYTVLENFSYYYDVKDKKDEKQIKTSIGQASYNWENTIKFSEYKEVNANLSTKIDNFTGFNFTPNDKVFIYQIADDNSYLSLVLNSLENRSTKPKITIVYGNGNEEIVIAPISNVSSITPMESRSIVLENDVSLNNVAIDGFIKAGNINIIGNNYYISYFDNPLYKTINSNESSSYFKDLNLLGETYNKSIFISGNINCLSLDNISIYGSIINYKNTIIYNTDSQGGAIIYNPDLKGFENDLEINGIKIYSSINNFKVSNSSENDLTLFYKVNKLKSGEIYGVVKTINGEDGSVGGNASVPGGNKAGDGGEGTSGSNIYIVNKSQSFTSLKFANKGLLITGNGGNGGGGGASAKGWTDENKKESGNGGQGGSAGYIYGIGTYENNENSMTLTDSTGENYFASNGQDGKTGATSRSSFGEFKINSKAKWLFGEGAVPKLELSVRSYKSTNYIAKSYQVYWALENYQEGREKEIDNVMNILKSVYCLSEGYAQKPPEQRRESQTNEK